MAVFNMDFPDTKNTKCAAAHLRLALWLISLMAAVALMLLTFLYNNDMKAADRASGIESRVNSLDETVQNNSAKLDLLIDHFGIVKSTTRSHHEPTRAPTNR